MVPGRYFYSKNYIPKKYAAVKNIIKDKIKFLGYWCSLTTDGWTSYTGQTYLSLTCHKLSESWERENYFLSLHPLTEAHTSEYLNKVITNTLIDFEIDTEKIISITHDQGSNIKKAAS
jgi:hypothetical protein